MREYFSCNDINEALLCFDELDKKAHSQTVERVLALAFDMKHRERQQANALLRELVKRDKLSSEELVAGYVVQGVLWCYSNLIDCLLQSFQFIQQLR